MDDGTAHELPGVIVEVSDPDGGPALRLTVSEGSTTLVDEPSRHAGPELLRRLLDRSDYPSELVRLVASAVLTDGEVDAEQLRHLVEVCADPAVRELAAAHPALPEDALRALLVDPDRSVRGTADRHPGAAALADHLLPTSAPGTSEQVGLGTDPWPHHWRGWTLDNVEASGVGDLHAAGIYREHPLAQSFDCTFPVPLAVEVVDHDALHVAERAAVVELAEHAETVWVLRSIDDPRAWCAAGVVARTKEEWEGRWTTTGLVLSQWLRDPRCQDAVIAWLSHVDRFLPRAVASVLAAWTVLAPGRPHDGLAALGSSMVPGWWRRGWISPLASERAHGLMFASDDVVAPVIYGLLVHDRSRQVRTTLARVARPADITPLLPLATDHDPEVRVAFTENHADELHLLPLDTLLAMAADPLDEVRRTLADTQGLPEEVRTLLVDDPDWETSARAAARSLEGPRCGWLCFGHRGNGQWDCTRAAEVEARLDDGTTIRLCRQHRHELNPWGPKVRCVRCGRNPARFLDLTGDSSRPAPVCNDCGEWVNDYNNGGVTTGPEAWAKYQSPEDLPTTDPPKRPPGF